MKDVWNRFALLDWKKWLENTVTFLAPLGILYLLFVQVGVQSDGFQPADFYPTSEVIGGMILYAVNVLLDLLKKLKVAV